MQAIMTKYLGPTDRRDSRIKASAHAGSVTLSWDHRLNPTDNHKRAALTLATRLGWSYGEWHGGGMPHAGMVWVCAGSGDSFTVPRAGDTCPTATESCGATDYAC